LNILDLAILAMIAASILFGLYRGFAVTFCNFAGSLLAWLAAILFSGKLAVWVSENTTWLTAIRNYTEGSLSLAQTGTSIATDIETMRTGVATVAPANVTTIVSSAKLPPPLDKLIEQNIIDKVFANKTFQESPIATMGDYCNQTLAEFTLNVLSFIAIFFGVSLLIMLLVGIINAVVKLPVLRQMDALAGGAVGLLRGVLIVLAIFLLLPVGLSIVNVDIINDLIAESLLSKFFYGGNFMLNAIRGFLG